MDFATHLNAVVQCIDRVATVVLRRSVALQLALVDTVPLHVLATQDVVVSMLAPDTVLSVVLQRRQMLILVVRR